MELIMASNELNHLIECPVCLDILHPPVRLCSTGHGLCQSCSSQVKACPLCQAVFTALTPVPLNQILEALPRRCCFERSGCKEVFKLGDAHEKFCVYRPTSCRLFECQWQGPLSSLVPHLRRYHEPPELVTAGCVYEIKFQNFDLNKDFKTFKPIVMRGEVQVLWQVSQLDISRKLLLFSLYRLPEQPSTAPLMAELILEKDLLRYSFTTPVCSEGVGDEDVHSLKNFMLVPLSALIDLIQPNNELILRLKLCQTRIIEVVPNVEYNEDSAESESESEGAVGGVARSKPKASGLRSSHGTQVEEPVRDMNSDVSSSSYRTAFRFVVSKAKVNRTTKSQKPCLSKPTSKRSGQLALIRSHLTDIAKEQKQMLGERLYLLVQKIYPDKANKITGMLLELDNSYLLDLLKDKELLKSKVEEAVNVLQAYKMKVDKLEEMLQARLVKLRKPKPATDETKANENHAVEEEKEHNAR